VISLISNLIRRPLQVSKPHPANDLFQALFDAAPECIKLQARDGRIERINSAGLAILETSRQQSIVGRSIYDVMAAEYHARYRELTQNVFSGGTGFMEFELLTFGGQRRWLETHAVPLRDERGQVFSLLAITRDIDKRKRMTRQLEEQRNRLNTIIESEPECVKLHDRYGLILEMNPAGLALLGTSDPSKVVGHSVFEFISEEYRLRYRELTDKVFAGERDRMEFEVDTVTGKRRWLETHAAPLKDAQGRVTSLLAITRDIDERKRNEEKLRLQECELAHMCRLNMLGELAAGLAHELNQPLCAISSYAETAQLLNARKGSQQVQDIDPILHKIVDETQRASGIIQGMRDFVRKRSPRPQVVDVGDLVRESVQLVEPERRRRRVEFELSIDSGLPRVRADKVQIKQVFLNLVSNALQAIEEAPRCPHQIRIKVCAAHDQVVVAVRDYAGGVPVEMRAHLFTPFFTTKPDGIGIGLSLSRGIAEAQGGQLNYQAMETGSLFQLSLPVYEE
jgi:two-component system sensor kinase FixL